MSEQVVEFAEGDPTPQQFLEGEALVERGDDEGEGE